MQHCGIKGFKSRMSTRDNFELGAMVFVTTTDYPANDNLSGQTIKGGFACLLSCGDDTFNLFLKNSWKTIYMRHRQFLCKNHRYRNMASLFDNTKEQGLARKTLSGAEVFKKVQNVNVFLAKRKHHAP